MLLKGKSKVNFIKDLKKRFKGCLFEVGFEYYKKSLIINYSVQYNLINSYASIIPNSPALLKSKHPPS